MGYSGSNIDLKSVITQDEVFLIEKGFFMVYFRGDRPKINHVRSKPYRFFAAKAGNSR